MNEDDDMALTVFNALANGMGGLDWAGLDFHVSLFGITDVEGLVQRLHVIKGHRPKDAPP